MSDEKTRVETETVKFDDDWPGIFIRGDNAAYYAMLLKSCIASLEKNADSNDP